jgi:hypothetical protein
MHDGLHAVPWQNYVFVEIGNTTRNELAHDAKLITKADCLAFVDAIEAELVVWRVL